MGLFVNETPQEGLTLFNPGPSTTSYLVSTDGLLVHSWTTSYRPGAMGYLLENGHLLRSARLSVVDSRWLGVAAAGGRVEEFDWDGDLLWEFEYSSPDHLTHHDMEPLPKDVSRDRMHRLNMACAAAQGILSRKDPSLVREFGK